MADKMKKRVPVKSIRAFCICEKIYMYICTCKQRERETVKSSKLLHHRQRIRVVNRFERIKERIKSKLGGIVSE